MTKNKSKKSEQTQDAEAEAVAALAIAQAEADEQARRDRAEALAKAKAEAAEAEARRLAEAEAEAEAKAAEAAQAEVDEKRAAKAAFAAHKANEARLAAEAAGEPLAISAQTETEAAQSEALSFAGAVWSVGTLSKIAHRCVSSMHRTPLSEQASSAKYSRKGVRTMHEYDFEQVPAEVRERVKAEIDVALAFEALAAKLGKLSKVSKL